jgi:glycosyltransferase involved in cell wall biosynthesis
MLFFLTRLVRRYLPLTRIIFLCHHIIAPDGGIFDWFLARRVLWRGHAFIVMSEEDFAFLRRALPWARIRGTLHPPYNMFSHTPMPQAEARARLGLYASERVLLFFGFVRRYKGLRYLLDAMALVHQAIPVRLLVVGEFWEDERPYREQVRQLGLQDAITFYNSYVPNDEVAVYFSAADAVVLPYLEATQSGIAQVALGFEKPMIATAVGGMGDVVQPEQMGLLVPPADSAALAAAIVRYFGKELAVPFARKMHELKESASWLPLVKLIEEVVVMQ